MRRTAREHLFGTLQLQSAPSRKPFETGRGSETVRSTCRTGVLTCPKQTVTSAPQEDPDTPICPGQVRTPVLRGRDSELSLETACGPRAGFSLLELMAVMALMVILLSIALISQVDWGRSKALNGALRGTKSNLGLARQMAVTHHTTAIFVYGNDTSVTPNRGYHYIATNDTDALISNTNFLPKGMAYTNDGPLTLEFGADGTGAGDSSEWPGGYRDLVIYEPERASGESCLWATVRVARVTGTARVVE